MPRSSGRLPCRRHVASFLDLLVDRLDRRLQGRHAGASSEADRRCTKYFVLRSIFCRAFRAAACSSSSRSRRDRCSHAVPIGLHGLQVFLHAVLGRVRLSSPWQAGRRRARGTRGHLQVLELAATMADARVTESSRAKARTRTVTMRTAVDARRHHLEPVVQEIFPAFTSSPSRVQKSRRNCGRSCRDPPSSTRLR